MIKKGDVVDNDDDDDHVMLILFLTIMYERD